MNSKQEAALRMAADNDNGVIEPRNSMMRHLTSQPTTGTLDALVRRGYMEKASWRWYRITQAGRAVIAPPEGTFDLTS